MTDVQDLNNKRPALSVIVTIVSGRESLRRCLKTLISQIEAADVEIIVPYDSWSVDIAELGSEFPDVRFHRISEGVPNSAPEVVHRLYDRRRAVGLALARGRIVALTEDHVIPAHDWCERIIEAHQCPFDAIGGAIENGINRPLNWAWYYCDFGRYGRPLPEIDVRYASDVNISYKRDTLERVRDVWQDTYQETTMHWALQKRGGTIALDSRPVVYQHRPPMSFRRALTERVQWARVFAETRAARVGRVKRLLYVLVTPLLPALLYARVFRHMLRQRRSVNQFVTVMPVVLGLLVGWSLGELAGYVFGGHAPDVGVVGIRSIPILMYHSLDSSGSVTSITPKIFEAQMAWLSELRYRVVSLRQAVVERQEKGEWPDKSVVLTFDDGYANVHEHALPVLVRHGFSATVFVVAGHVSRANDWAQPPHGLGRQTMLSWNQMKDLVDHGVEIGAHTISHLDLSGLEPEAIEREIVGSVEEINSHLSEPVQTFAYPFGSISDEAVAVVGRTFRAACTTVHRRACDEPLSLLPRIEMYYFRNQRNLQPLISGQLDRKLTLRRWARSIRRFLPF